jgi:hypothetical protein
MDVSTFAISVFCIVDDWFGDRKLRRRGFAPTLSDSEVLTIEIVGEFLGIDTDQGLYRYFRRHYGDWFPGLCRIHRTTFARQATNLGPVKEKLWQHVAGMIARDPEISIIDSFPVPVCRFARAYRHKSLAEVAAWGFDDVAKQRFYGLRAHMLICWPGVIIDGRLVAADEHDLAVADDVLADATGWALGDRNYWSPNRKAWFEEQGLVLTTPFKLRTVDHEPWPHWLTNARRRIETVIGQLVGRYNAKRVWARDPVHLWSRWLRKLLSHTIAVFLCQQSGLPPLRFSDLVVDA